VTLDGAPLRGFVGGRTGPATPLVMLHGTALDDATLSFGPVLPRLATGRRLLALDWPGHGGSALRRFRNLDGEVIFLARAITAFGIGRADLLGFSMGGSFALAYALAFPERVRTLTLVSSHGLGRLVLPIAPKIALAGPTPTLALALANRIPALVLSGGRMSRSLQRELHERAADPQRRTAFLMWLRRELRPWRYRTDLTPRLRRLRAPTLLIHGRHDLVAPWGRSLRASKRIARARFRLLDAGHWLPRQQPRQFARIVARFLDDPQGVISEV
jgi:pimeloyl-ACP methyl ester carboxylesterase